MAKKKGSTDMPKWQAEQDAYNLVSVQEIMDDKKRYSAAIKEVNKIKQDAEKRLNAAGKIS